MKHGFTLIELSVILIVVALLLAGILMGQDMMRNAELGSAQSDVQQFNVAMQNFRLKYSQLPGDFNRASEYWTQCVDNGANTCNGNNDKSFTANEVMRFWQHLVLPGLIEGTYTGGQNVGDTSQDIYPFIFHGPLSIIQITGYNDKTDTAVVTSGSFFYQEDTVADPIKLKEDEMYYLDQKFDDGDPEFGDIRVIPNNGSSSGCLTNTAPAEYDYGGTGDYADCLSAFKIHF